MITVLNSPSVLIVNKLNYLIKNIKVISTKASKMDSPRKISTQDENKPLIIRDMTSELQKKAQNELNEVASKNYEYIKQLKEWIKEQPHLNARTDDQWLLNFCRSCKFDLEATKERLDTYYSLRSNFPELFTNRDPLLPEIQNILNLGLCLPLLKTDGEDGPRIILFRATKTTDDNITLIDVVKTQLLILDILMNEDDNFIVAGQSGLVNLKGVCMEFLFDLNVQHIQKASTIIEKAYLTNPKGMYIINNSFYFEKMFRVILGALPQNLASKMIIFRDNDQAIYKYIPKSLVPQPFSKDDNSIENLTEYWKKKVESCRDWLIDDEQYGIDESKRPQGMNKIALDLQNIENFRKLEID